MKNITRIPIDDGAARRKEFDAFALLRVVGFTAIWTAIYGFLSRKILLFVVERCVN